MLLSYLLSIISEENTFLRNFASFACVGFLIVFAYLLGSHNVCRIVAKLFFKTNLKKDKGAMPTLKEMAEYFGTKGFILCVLLIGILATIGTLVGFFVMNYTNAEGLSTVTGAPIALFFLVVGQMMPCFNKFRGTNGICFLLCGAFWVSPICCLITFALYLLVVFGTKYLSMGALMASLLFPLMLKAFANKGLNVAMGALMAICVFVTVLPHLKAMRDGTEEKFDLLAFFKGFFAKPVKNEEEAENSEEK